MTSIYARSRSIKLRAFTLVELSVTVFLMGIVMAFVLPQITSAATMGQEQQAKSSINATLDAVVASYGRIGTSGGYDTTGDTPRALAPDISAATIRAQAPDVLVATTPATASTRNDQVSVAINYMNSDGVYWYRVGVAAYASGTAASSTCWLAYRDLDAKSSTHSDGQFLVIDMSDAAASESQCTGAVAAHIGDTVDGTALGAPILSQLVSTAPVDTGKSWQRPRAVTGAQAATALARGSAPTVIP